MHHPRRRGEDEPAAPLPRTPGGPQFEGAWGVHLEIMGAPKPIHHAVNGEETGYCAWKTLHPRRPFEGNFSWQFMSLIAT